VKIAVIISDATGLINAGLDVDRFVRNFEMPEDMCKYIASRIGPYKTVTFALVDEEGNRDAT
jgi:hypothetical protein